MNYIYTLTDPRDNMIKYIGKTKNVENRLKRHINESNSNSKKDNWIKKMKLNGLYPIIDILDIGDDIIINELEIYWISQFISWGFDLKNFTNGGDGGWDDKKHTELSKEKMRNNNPNMKSVVLFDKDMNPLKKFKSLREASRVTELERPFILRSCREKTTACRCNFRHSDLNFDENINWKSFLIKREYNELYSLYSINEWNYLISSSLSYKEVISKIYNNSNKLIDYDANRSKIYRILKKLNISTEHFTRKRKKKNI